MFTYKFAILANLATNKEGIVRVKKSFNKPSCVFERIQERLVCLFVSKVSLKNSKRRVLGQAHPGSKQPPQIRSKSTQNQSNPSFCFLQHNSNFSPISQRPFQHTKFTLTPNTTFSPLPTCSISTQTFSNFLFLLKLTGKKVIFFNLFAFLSPFSSIPFHLLKFSGNLLQQFSILF